MENRLIHSGTDGAEIFVSLSGGCLTAYRLTDREKAFDILRPLDTGQPGEVAPREAASFPLVPYSNRIRNGRFSFAGEDHQLALNFGDHPHSIHGVGWQLPWRLQAQESNRIVINLAADNTDWPFAFHARQTFTLDEASLKHELELTNRSDRPMPAGLGMHPYFLRHSGARLTADVKNVWQTDETCLPTERIPCPDHWNLRGGPDVDSLLCDNQFEPWHSPARITWQQEGRAVALTASKDLDRLVVYAPDGEEYFCVEPTSHITDAFNRTANGMSPEDSGMRILEPGETWSVWMMLTPEAP